MTFKLDNRLINDCIQMGQLENTHLLLMNNALYPWFILVPETSQPEFHQLTKAQQLVLLQQTNQLAQFIEQHFDIEKINTACIGNIVRQLHIHVVGRHSNDAAWPGVVWGHSKSQLYDEENIAEIKGWVTNNLDIDPHNT